MTPQTRGEKAELERVDLEERLEWEPPEIFQAIVLDDPPLDSTNCGTCYDAR